MCIKSIEVKGETVTLDNFEVAELNELSVDLLDLSKLQYSILWQKSRLNWLKECDVNSKFFHGFITFRIRSNAITTLVVDGGICGRGEFDYGGCFLTFSVSFLGGGR